jgi:hypothetical protein
LAAITFNVSLGKAAYYAGLPAANDSLIAVLLASSGLDSDATLRDEEDLDGILATNTEASFSGYSRQTLTSVNATVDPENDWVDIDCADIQWSPTTSEAIGKIVICYKPDTGSADTDIIPIFADDFNVTVSSGTVTYQVATDGFYRAQ